RSAVRVRSGRDLAGPRLRTGPITRLRRGPTRAEAALRLRCRILGRRPARMATARGNVGMLWIFGHTRPPNAVERRRRTRRTPPQDSRNLPSLNRYIINKRPRDGGAFCEKRTFPTGAGDGALLLHLVDEAFRDEHHDDEHDDGHDDPDGLH